MAEDKSTDDLIDSILSAGAVVKLEWQPDLRVGFWFNGCFIAVEPCFSDMYNMIGTFRVRETRPLAHGNVFGSREGYETTLRTELEQRLAWRERRLAEFAELFNTLMCAVVKQDGYKLRVVVAPKIDVEADDPLTFRGLKVECDLDDSGVAFKFRALVQLKSYDRAVWEAHFHERMGTLAVLCGAWRLRGTVAGVPKIPVTKALSLRRICRVRGPDPENMPDELVEPFGRAVVKFL